jgi:hypothetical protein
VHAWLSHYFLYENVLELRNYVIFSITANVLFSRFPFSIFSLFPTFLGGLTLATFGSPGTYVEYGMHDSLVALEELALHELVSLARI